MAWVMPDKRKCPSCGHDERTLVIHGQDGGYRLSCSWCANLSERMGAHEAFFTAWTDKAYPRGHIMDLQGVPHWDRGAYVESVPIRVINNGLSALVVAQSGDDKNRLEAK